MLSTVQHKVILQILTMKITVLSKATFSQYHINSLQHTFRLKYSFIITHKKSIPTKPFNEVSRNRIVDKRGRKLIDIHIFNETLAIYFQ